MVEGNGFWNSIAGRLTRITCAGCTPDAADYGGDVEVLDRTAETLVASVDGGIVDRLPGAGLLVVLTTTLALVAWRRRGDVL